MACHLRSKGRFEIFLDVKSLQSGYFNYQLGNAVANSRNFLLVCSPVALDRCKNDEARKDWVHLVRFIHLMRQI